MNCMPLSISPHSGHCLQENETIKMIDEAFQLLCLAMLFHYVCLFYFVSKKICLQSSSCFTMNDFMKKHFCKFLTDCLIMWHQLSVEPRRWSSMTMCQKHWQKLDWLNKTVSILYIISSKRNKPLPLHSHWLLINKFTYLNNFKSLKRLQLILIDTNSFAAPILKNVTNLNISRWIPVNIIQD